VSSVLKALGVHLSFLLYSRSPPAFHAPCGGHRESHIPCVVGVRCVSSVPKTLGMHVSFLYD
jgi:hypothetical protein